MTTCITCVRLYVSLCVCVCLCVSVSADKLHLGDVVVTQPTIGSNVEHITHKNVHFEAWDLGGQVLSLSLTCALSPSKHTALVLHAGKYESNARLGPRSFYAHAQVLMKNE